MDIRVLDNIVKIFTTDEKDIISVSIRPNDVLQNTKFFKYKPEIVKRLEFRKSFSEDVLARLEYFIKLSRYENPNVNSETITFPYYDYGRDTNNGNRNSCDITLIVKESIDSADKNIGVILDFHIDQDTVSVPKTLSEADIYSILWASKKYKFK